MSARAALERALCLTVMLGWLAWGCGANCLRDSDCDEGLVCSRDRCVLESQRAADAGPSNTGAAGSTGGTSSAGGSGGRPPLPSSSTGGSASGAAGGAGTGGSATAGRENLDASVDTDAGSNRN